MELREEGTTILASVPSKAANSSSELVRRVSAWRYAVEDALNAYPVHLVTFVQAVKRGSCLSRTGGTLAASAGN